MKNRLLILAPLPFLFVNNSYAIDTQEPSSKPALFTELMDYARLADSAYESRDSVASLAKTLESELTVYENLPELGVNYLLLTDVTHKTHWIAIRGTVNAENTLVNLDIQLMPNRDLDIEVHRGFADTAKTIFKNITPRLNKEFTTHVTGHSLGGAVATVLAMYLDTNAYKVTRVVTFGQPKVTNITGAQKFSHLDILRVVTANDFVPLLPPVDVTDINKVGIYWPLGQELILLDKNTYSIARELDSLLRATKFLNRQPDMKNLQEHQMTYYLQAINNRQQGAQWIPYRNDFSMFSIFGETK